MALTAEDIVNKRFQSTKFREGYDQDEVDDFLDPTVSGSTLPPAYEVRQLYQIRWQEATE